MDDILHPTKLEIIFGHWLDFSCLHTVSGQRQGLSEVIGTVVSNIKAIWCSRKFSGIKINDLLRGVFEPTTFTSKCNFLVRCLSVLIGLRVVKNNLVL